MDKELDDFEELEELEEVAELEELEDLAELEELDDAAGAPAASANGESSGPRELEKAPLMLKKSALILTIAAVFPWLVPSEDGFPVERTLAKLVVLLGGYVMFMGVKRNHGAKVPGVFDSLGGMHPKALTILGLVIMAVGIAPLIDAGGDVMRGVVAKAAVAVGVVVLCQVQDYAMGGKFNPVAGLVIPMFGIGGLARLATVLGNFDPLALIGSVGVVVAGALAGYTLVVAMKEAKEHGKAKKAAAVEARKRQRQAKKHR